jgi:hypothetical protein
VIANAAAAVLKHNHHSGKEAESAAFDECCEYARSEVAFRNCV